MCVALLLRTVQMGVRLSPADRASRRQISVLPRGSEWNWGILLLATCLVVVTSYPQWNLVNPSGQGEARELYAWAADTASDAVFVVPPELEEFRLRSARAVVADWKSTPILPEEVMEWYERMVAISGRPVSGVEDASDAYREMTATDRAALIRFLESL